MSILDELAAHARERVLADSENMSLDILQAMCREKGRANGARFYDALKKDDLSFICEVKKASPSKGVIARDFPYLDIARDYEAAGADCISCLTEPKWFLGSDDIFREIRAAVSTPMLRKDFTVSDYQLYQSRLMGEDHRRQQPQSEGFFRRLFQRRAAARPHPAGGGLRGRIRRAERAGHRRTPLDRRRRGADRRNTDAGPRQGQAARGIER